MTPTHKSNLAETALYMLKSDRKLDMKAVFKQSEEAWCFGGFMKDLFPEREDESYDAWIRRVLGEDSFISPMLFAMYWQNGKFQAAARALAVLNNDCAEWKYDYTHQFYEKLTLKELKKRLWSFVQV